jgi:phosphinothricin acetyltransferase
MPVDGLSAVGIVRLATDADAAAVQAIYAPFCERTPVSFETVPPTVDEIRRRIGKTLEQLPWLVCDDGGSVAGYVYASPHRERAAYRWSVDVAVYVREDCRGRGVGRALYTSLLHALGVQGYYNAYAGITLPNPASVGLHEAVGFRPLAVYRGVGYRLGAWHDVGWWHLALKPLAAEPAEPRPLTEVCGTHEWTVAIAAGLPFLRPAPTDDTTPGSKAGRQS